jgi:tRNA A37 threonylcarbamoyladenosine synthetase subunit TsaC/SUA5/YrdC
MNEKKKTIGIRVPANNIALALLEALGEPLLSTT